MRKPSLRGYERESPLPFNTSVSQLIMHQFYISRQRRTPGKGRLSSLENRRLQDILILMYKVKNSLAPEHVCKIFFQQDKHYNLRSDFPFPRYNTVKYGSHSIRYLGPHIWGKIRQELRSKTSLQAFRREVRALSVLGSLDGTCCCCACSS